MNTIQIIQFELNKKGLKPSKMMSDLGFSSGLFSQWKSGKQNPSMDKLQKIADYLKVDINYLLDKNDDTRKEDLDIRRIQRARSKMPQEEKDRMMAVIENAFYKYFSDDYVDDDIDE